ncbi:MAG: sugar transferase [Streptomyces sp.]|uniref:sugar transferase n=1 Tax=Streptomyces sp. TaxID=1931 RepID=UPI003D6C2916
MTTDDMDERSHAAQVVTREHRDAPAPGAEAGVTVPSPQSHARSTAPPVRGVPNRRHRLLRHRGAVPLAVADVLTAMAVVFALRGLDADPLLLVPVVCGALALNARAGLYRPGLEAHAMEELPVLGARTAVVWCLAAALLAAFDRPAALSWTALLAVVAAHVALAGTARALVHGGLRRHARRHPRSVLIVGGGELARTVATVLAERPQYGLRPVGFVELGPPDDAAGAGDVVGADGVAGTAPLPVIVVLEDVTRAVIQNTVRNVIFLRSPWERRQDAVLAGLLSERGVTGWLIRPGCAVGAHGTHHRGPAHVWGFSCRRLPLECPPAGRSWRKRLLDLVLVVPALIAALPVLAACALLVRLSDGPGVIFRQERIGLGGRPFTLLKFRTLRPADERESATRWSVAGDDRMSRVGRVMRRSSLDELPQLWNVVRGDMSLVGPRPERPYFVQQFSRELPGYSERHRGPVGITGLAQVHGLRGNTSIEDRARFDNHYIETWSLWQDVRIMCRTVTSFFRLEGR